MHRKKMKQKAKELLQGIWGRAIALLFCLAAIMVFFSCLERMIVSFSGMSTLEQLFSPLFLYGTVSVHIDTLLFASALFIGSSVLSFLFGTSLRQGIICWYYRRTLGEILPISRTFNWYTSPKRWGKALAVHLLLLVKTALWTALFLCPRF